MLLQTVAVTRPIAPPDAAVAADRPTTTQLGAGLVGVRTDRVDMKATNTTYPAAYAGYLLPFEIISIHLVVVLVGAAYLARARRRVTTDERGLDLSEELRDER